MKKIEAIIRPSKLEELKEALLKIQVNGITITQVMGCGKQLGWKEFYRGSEVILNVLPKVKLELVVSEDNFEQTINLILEVSKTGEVGDGKIFVSTIDDAYRIRTGETGDAALN
ncbi:MAG: transcriptional regulator [Clostridiales bacterium 43-6]|nr:MAG: transcriptional regulator [Clostridiales bacterium 43-6]